MATAQGSAAGVPKAMPVPGHPPIGGIHARPQPRKHRDPRHRNQPPDASGEVQEGVGSSESAAIRQQQLDLTGQFTGGEMEFIGDGGILQGHEWKSAGGEDRMPPVAQAGADRAEGIEPDATARFHSFSTSNVYFSIHGNLRSKNFRTLSGPVPTQPSARAHPQKLQGLVPHQRQSRQGRRRPSPQLRVPARRRLKEPQQLPQFSLRIAVRRPGLR
jgi:hypothetical protein